MPRKYRLGERATQLAATRERIVDAAIELSMELGISATTMRRIATEADVAPGTLRAHFPTRDDLDRAMVDRLTGEAPLPELSIFEGAASIEERLTRLIDVAGAFIDQSHRLYRMWQRERMLTEPWNEAGARYGVRWDDLMRTALGPLADDADAMAILRGVLDPAFFANVRSGRRTTEQASVLIAEAIVPWFAARAAG
jgi:AcrR family transcriptional regulator